MKVAVQQPHFLPWPPYWHKMLSVDTFVLWTGIPYSYGEYINRVQHAKAWLTLPVNVPIGTLIRDVTLSNDARRLAKIAKTLQQYRGPYSKRLEEIVGMVAEIKPGDSLAYVNGRLLAAGLRALGAKDLVLIEEAETPTNESKTGRIADVIRKFAPEATEYYSGRGALDYMGGETLDGIRVRWQSLEGFDPSVSIVQLIANEPDPIDWLMSSGSWSA